MSLNQQVVQYIAKKHSWERDKHRYKKYIYGLCMLRDMNIWSLLCGIILFIAVVGVLVLVLGNNKKEQIIK